MRALVAHQESSYEEWGASGSVRIDPGASGRGLSLTVAPALGAAPSGVERLWSQSEARDLAGGASSETRGRPNAEIGYGMGLSRAGGVLMPYTGVSLSGSSERTLRLGARWRPVPNLRPDPARRGQAPRGRRRGTRAVHNPKWRSPELVAARAGRNPARVRPSPSSHPLLRARRPRPLPGSGGRLGSALLKRWHPPLISAKSAFSPRAPRTALHGRTGTARQRQRSSRP